MYFALVYEDEDPSKVVSNPIIHFLRVMGFKGTRHILHNFLWPNYYYAIRNQKSNPFLRFSVVTLLIFMKIVIPTFVLISPIKANIIIYSGIFTGFYLHFVSTLFELVKNDDIKVRNYLYLSLMKLVTIHRDYDDMLDITCPISL